MLKEIENAIKEYQCSGCTNGCDISCFDSIPNHCGCDAHSVGTIISNIGYVYLGMPK